MSNSPPGRPWIREWQAGAPARLICLPYAGGGTADFRRWREGLLPAVDLVPVLLPGRENRLAERPAESLPSLLESLVPALLPALSAAPFVLYGHSMGAWVAFELARALRRAGGPMPEHLVVSARRAPHRPARLPPLSQLPDSAFVEQVQQRYGAIPEVIRSNPELMGLFLPALRADFTLLDRYTFQEEPPLAVPVTAWLGQDDHVEVEADLRAWSELTTGPFQFRWLPGGHFFLKDAMDEVTDALNAILRPLVQRP